MPRRRRAPSRRAPPREIAPSGQADPLGPRGDSVGWTELTRELEARLRETVETVGQVFGDQHPHYATALENLASTLRRVGRIEEAHAIEARLLAVRNALLVQKSRPRRRDPDEIGTAPPARRGSGPQRLPPAVVDIPSAARYLAISPDTLYGLVRSGEVPHTRVGKSIRFRVWDLDRYLEERTSRHWTRLDRRGRPSRR